LSPRGLIIQNVNVLDANLGLATNAEPIKHHIIEFFLRAAYFGGKPSKQKTANPSNKSIESFVFQ